MMLTPEVAMYSKEVLAIGSRHCSAGAEDGHPLCVGIWEHAHDMECALEDKTQLWAPGKPSCLESLGNQIMLTSASLDRRSITSCPLAIPHWPKCL